MTKHLGSDSSQFQMFGVSVTNTEEGKQRANDLFSDRKKNLNKVDLDLAPVDEKYSSTLTGKTQKNLVLIESQASGYSNADAQKLANAVMDYQDAYFKFAIDYPGDGKYMPPANKIQQFDTEYFQKHQNVNKEDVMLWATASSYSLGKNEDASLESTDPEFRLAIGICTQAEYHALTGKSVSLAGAHFLPETYMPDQVTKHDRDQWSGGTYTSMWLSDLKDSIEEKFQRFKEALHDVSDAIKAGIEAWKDAHPKKDSKMSGYARTAALQDFGISYQDAQGNQISVTDTGNAIAANEKAKALQQRSDLRTEQADTLCEFATQVNPDEVKSV